jgi:copper oxidase (laccase) domain-containing protein
MKENFDCNSQDIKAVIGPSICKNCYPCDLWQENKRQLLAAEIPIENLKLTKLCTACNANDQYYSYRKNNKTSLRNYSYILLL